MNETTSRPRVFNLAGSAESRARGRAEGMAVLAKFFAQSIDSPEIDDLVAEPGNPELERLERALAAISYAILLDGPVYAPVLDRLEREIAAVHTSGDVVSRARQHLDRLRDQAATGSARRVKAIA
jgi:hypothetical protein